MENFHALYKKYPRDVVVYGGDMILERFKGHYKELKATATLFAAMPTRTEVPHTEAEVLSKFEFFCCWLIVGVGKLSQAECDFMNDMFDATLA